MSFFEEPHVQILVKTLVTLVAGALTFLLTNITEQPKMWQTTMPVFVAGVVLVVQFLIDVAEQTRKRNENSVEQARQLNAAYREQAAELADSVGRISEAAAHLATAEGHLGRPTLTRLIEAAGRLDRREDLQLLFVRVGAVAGVMAVDCGDVGEAVEARDADGGVAQDGHDRLSGACTDPHAPDTLVSFVYRVEDVAVDLLVHVNDTGTGEPAVGFRAPYRPAGPGCFNEPSCEGGHL